jgi:hypothetical protein
MKKAVVIFVIVLAVALAAGLLASNRTSTTTERRSNDRPQPDYVPQAPPVPAHFNDAASARPLKATLDPTRFTGRTKRAYEVAREIPETLAQIPCYCYCDRGFGHKSLHSCYEDDHSSQCATCVDEALMAYQLEKEQKLSPSQIREKIIERFSRQ